MRSPLGVLLGATASLLITSIGVPDDKLSAWFGNNGPTVFTRLQLAGSITAILLLFSCIVRTLMRLRHSNDPVAQLRATRFGCRVLDTIADAKLINGPLVKRMFPAGSIETSHSIMAQEKNPCRLLGLIDCETQEIAGWSSLWPVTVEAGEAIEHGRRVDDDLKVQDLLPKRRNATARYLILLSFGILPEYRDAAECPTRRLGRFVIDHIITNFLITTGRNLRLVAVAYSPEGERMCSLLGLERNGCFADYSDGQRKPIYAGDVDIAKLVGLSHRH